MRYSTLLALLPLASAVDVAKREDTDLKYEVSDFAAFCMSDGNLCIYELSMFTSNNPDFVQSCEVSGKSNNGELPAVSETQCGTYVVSVAKLDAGALALTVKSNRKQFTGTHNISKDDLETTTSGGDKLQSYKGDTSFTINARSISSASTSASVSTTSSASPTTTSESSTTTSDGASSSSDPEDTNDAARRGAFAGALFALGSMLLAF